jgi:excisionase family DNA binding protein
MADRLLTTTEAGKRLGGISRQRILQFIQEGRLPARRMGRDWFIEARHLARVRNRRAGRPPKHPKRESPRGRGGR